MLRFLLWAVILYLLYRFFRKVFGAVPGYDPPREVDRIDDLMVKDPYCDVYFPKKTGHHLRIDGKDLYFCSPECRENYRREQAGKDA